MSTTTPTMTTQAKRAQLEDKRSLLRARMLYGAGPLLAAYCVLLIVVASHQRIYLENITQSNGTQEWSKKAYVERRCAATAESPKSDLIVNCTKLYLDMHEPDNARALRLTYVECSERYHALSYFGVCDFKDATSFCAVILANTILETDSMSEPAIGWLVCMVFYILTAWSANSRFEQAMRKLDEIDEMERKQLDEVPEMDLQKVLARIEATDYTNPYLLITETVQKQIGDRTTTSLVVTTVPKPPAAAAVVDTSPRQYGVDFRDVVH